MAILMVSLFLRSDDAKGSKELLALAVKAAEAMVQVEGDRDASALINLASTYGAAGDKAKAKEVARKAVEAASVESDAVKQNIEKQAKSIGEDKKH